MQIHRLILCTGILVCSWNGQGECAVTSMPPSPLPRLDQGALVSGTELAANKNGAASIGVLIDGNNNVCNGVMVGPTTFVTSYCNPPTAAGAHVFVGGVLYPPTNYDGQALAVTSIVAYAHVNGSPVYNIRTTPIPPGSRAVSALQNPPNSTLPGPTATCMVFGYGSPSPPNSNQLNSLPVSITSYRQCRAIYTGLPAQSDGTSFCAIVPDNAPANQCVISPDYPVIMMCRQWLPNRRESRGGTQLDYSLTKSPTNYTTDPTLVQRCFSYGHWPWCPLVCAGSGNLFPFCHTQEDETPEPEVSWYLAGVEADNYNHCPGPQTLPLLFAYLPNL